VAFGIGNAVPQQGIFLYNIALGQTFGVVNNLPAANPPPQNPYNGGSFGNPSIDNAD
jgi:hypothetical protein